MNKAVFLDRDGTINSLVKDPLTGNPGAPLEKRDLQFLSGAIESILKLQENSFQIFVVSNQPDYAKGKTSLQNLLEVHNELDTRLSTYGVKVSEYYYCFHHPQGIVRDYSIECECRKPGTKSVDAAIEKYGIDRSLSWLVGDRESDIECGKKAGLKTAYLSEGQGGKLEHVQADIVAGNLHEAADRILELKQNVECHL